MSASNAFAAIIVVDNNVTAPAGVYTDLQVAVTAAAAGDTILLTGSSTSYGSCNVYKQLHFKGAGYDPDKQNALHSIANIIIYNAGLGNADSTSIEGLYGTFNLQNSVTNSSLSHILITRCQGNLVINSGNYNNIQVYNNWSLAIQTYYTPNLYNCIFSNNIFQNVDIHPSSTSTVLFTNNMFISSVGSSHTIFTNNIWYGYDPQSSSNYNTYNYNLVFGATNNQFTLTGTNTGGNNFEGVNPLFVNETNLYIDDTDDLNLLATSPVKNAGTDGTDLGIYGGPHPWPEGGISGSGFMYAQEANIPQVNQMDIQNASVPLNGTLNVEIKGITNH